MNDTVELWTLRDENTDLRRQLAEAQRQRDEAQAACAAMRCHLERYCDPKGLCGEAEQYSYEDVLASDAGRDFLARLEAAELRIERANGKVCQGDLMSAINPGEELDAAVARALGWVLADDNVWESPDGACHVLCHWSTDDACAVRDVLPEIERRGWTFSISGGATDFGCQCSIYDVKPLAHSTAKTLAHAICRAFLAAVEKTT